MLNRHLAIATLAVALLAGCGSATSNLSQGGSSAGSGGRGTEVPAALSPVAGHAGPAAGGIVVGTPASANVERSVAAAYTVPVGGFLNSFDGVIATAVGMGGYVVSSSTNPDATGRIVSGSVTLKIPAAKIADFLNGMPLSFTASSINFASVDHTAEFVDLNARLASAHAHLDALNGLLAKSTSLTDITGLEQQIETVQTEIDTDQGQSNVLTMSVSMSTATIALSERGATLAQAPGPVSDGIGSGWSNAVLATGAILEVTVTVLPFVAVAVAAWLLWRRLPRRVFARRAQQLEK